MQLLGIGGNGHIGFNEPGDAFEKETHCVDLTESTIRANSRFFESMAEVPKQAYTMGIRNIMAAKKILLVATGTSKAEALYNSLYGPITPKVPASILQLHPDLTVVADEDALSMIRKKLNKNPEYNCRIKKDASDSCLCRNGGPSFFAAQWISSPAVFCAVFISL